MLGNQKGNSQKHLGNGRRNKARGSERARAQRRLSAGRAPFGLLWEPFPSVTEMKTVAGARRRCEPCSPVRRGDGGASATSRPRRPSHPPRRPRSRAEKHLITIGRRQRAYI